MGYTSCCIVGHSVAELLQLARVPILAVSTLYIGRKMNTISTLYTGMYVCYFNIITALLVLCIYQVCKCTVITATLTVGPIPEHGGSIPACHYLLPLGDTEGANSRVAQLIQTTYYHRCILMSISQHLKNNQKVLTLTELT